MPGRRWRSLPTGSVSPDCIGGMGMRFGRGNSLMAPLLIGLAVVALLWPLGQPRDQRTAGPASRLAGLPSRVPARADEGTATPAAARTLLHLLGWGTGGAAI